MALSSWTNPVAPRDIWLDAYCSRNVISGVSRSLKKSFLRSLSLAIFYAPH